MGIEIERKFLLKNEDWKKTANKGSRIEQGFLSRSAFKTVRIRLINGKGFLTIKGAIVKMTRSEFEYEIPFSDGVELLKLCDKPLIEKTRFEVKWNNQTWEIDEFDGDNKGLVLAEIELETEGEAIELPCWIGEEVSEDTRYYNANLITLPFTKW